MGGERYKEMGVGMGRVEVEVQGRMLWCEMVTNMGR